VPPRRSAGEHRARLRGLAGDQSLPPVSSDEVDEKLAEGFEQPAAGLTEGDVNVAVSIATDLVGGEGHDAGQVLSVEKVEHPGDAQVDLDVVVVEQPPQHRPALVLMEGRGRAQRPPKRDGQGLAVALLAGPGEEISDDGAAAAAGGQVEVKQR
jgi:hypothetical protein